MFPDLKSLLRLLAPPTAACVSPPLTFLFGLFHVFLHTSDLVRRCRERVASLGLKCLFCDARHVVFSVSPVRGPRTPRGSTVFSVFARQLVAGRPPPSFPLRRCLLAFPATTFFPSCPTRDSSPRRWPSSPPFGITWQTAVPPSTRFVGLISGYDVRSSASDRPFSHSVSGTTRLDVLLRFVPPPKPPRALSSRGVPWSHCFYPGFTLFPS